MSIETPQECWQRVANTAIRDVVERGFARIIAEEKEMPPELPSKAPGELPSETVVYVYELATVNGQQFVMCKHNGEQLTIAEGWKGAKR